MKNIIIGIISGLISSIAFSIILFFVKPIVMISSKVCIETGEDLSIYKIKIVNKTLSKLINVDYSLHYCVDYEDGLSDVQEILPQKIKLTTLEKYNSQNTDYAVRLSYQIDEKLYPLKDNVRFVFTFQAAHPFSNTSICKKMEYRAKDFVKGDFETGKSMKFILNKQATKNTSIM